MTRTLMIVSLLHLTASHKLEAELDYEDIGLLRGDLPTPPELARLQEEID